jgi:peptidoglycan/xylan/chitin deacetylase (PgdA/CDA1 family)
MSGDDTTTFRSEARWYVKKLARRGVALGTTATGTTLARTVLHRMYGRARVRALTYHRFASLRHDPFAVDPSAFEEQMAFLSEHRRAVSLEDLERFVRGDADLADGSVLVTIDDGCQSTLEVALPILEKYGIPSVAFVSTSLIGLGRLALPEPYMDWDELRECTNRGMSIGSHSHSHRSMGQLPAEVAKDEFVRSRAMLEDQLGKKVSAFAYPFGTQGDFTD